jgi:uncharacterized protein
MDVVRQPWPWYVAGPLIGLTVPLLLILGNKMFGISSSLRHICAICVPAKIPFFSYNWRSEIWNLFFVTGILVGGMLSGIYLGANSEVEVNEALREELQGYGVSNFESLVPADLFNADVLLSLKGVILMLVGGFLVGFGTRYAGGCTSGHSITGIAMLQPASIIATICFMAGGFFAANILLPFVLSL